MNAMVLGTRLEYTKALFVVSLNDFTTLSSTKLGAGQFASENI
jgi:hypothetical protein